MKSLNEKLFQPLLVGINVTISIPNLDRGKVEAKNLVGVIMNVTDDGFYKIGTKEGTISSMFARNQIFECKETFLKTDEVPEGKELSVRTNSLQTSLTGGQGLFVSVYNKVRLWEV